MIRKDPMRFFAAARSSNLAVATICLAIVLAGLEGCGRTPSKGPRLPPALSTALAKGALNAGGEQPLWALQVRPKSISFSSQKVAAITLPNTGPSEAPNGGAWTGDAGGSPFRATITAVACSDAATGLTYPLTAEITALGATYRGCAAGAGQGLGPQS